MPQYVFLARWTSRGARGPRELTHRIDAPAKGISAHGGKITAPLRTMGQYDVVAIADPRADETANTAGAADDDDRARHDADAPGLDDRGVRRTPEEALNPLGASESESRATGANSRAA